MLDAVEKQRPFDGERSTITVGEAGTVDETAWLPGTTEDAKSYQRAVLTSSYFKNIRSVSALTGLSPGGKFALSVSDRSDVYFRVSRGPFGIYGERTGLKESTILHEALHSLSGLGDQGLYKLLTGNVASNSEEASRKITETLEDNDCLE